MQQNNTFIDIQNLTSKFSVKEIVFKYLSYLPLFILSFAIAYGVSTIYIRYKVPLYKSTAQMLIKGDLDNSKQALGSDLVSTALNGSKIINLDNEISLLSSKITIERAVRKYQFNIDHINEGKIKNSDLYKSGLFDIEFISIPDSSRSYYIKVIELNPVGGTVSIKEKEQQTINFKWNQAIYIDKIAVKFTQRIPILNSTTEPFLIVWKPVYQSVGEIASKIAYSVKGKTTVILMAIECENPLKGADILDAMIEVHKEANIENKNLLRKNTINFINDRLDFVTKELNGIETNIKDFKDDNKLYDVPSEFQLINTQLKELQLTIDKQKTQLAFVAFIQEYLSDRRNEKEIVPTNLGLEDISLVSMIRRYNDLQIQRKQLEQQTTLSGLNVKEQNALIEDVRKRILEALTNVIGQSNILLKNYKIKENEYLQRLSLLPTAEIRFLEMKRQQSVKQELYLYLYKKREESAIANASTVSDYEQIDKAVPNYTPFEPKVGNIRNFALLLGLIIPVLVIYLLDLFNDKVTIKEDITKKLNLPIVGEISHVNEKTNIVVNNSRSISAEQFRILRSNLQFILPKDKPNAQTILVTSSISGEGKSFISLNLAGILAFSGKKVALLEFDLRKLSNLKEFHTQINPKGITNYLIGQTNSFEEVKFNLKQFPTLDIFNTGPIPPNPAELMMDKKVEGLITWLKANYDYIIFDTAPVGLVSDAFALTNYTDVVLYVIRQRYTFKKQLDFIQEIVASQKLQNVSVVVNDVQLGGRYGYYGYGYGYGYGYLYKYGYGRKYGAYGTYGGGMGKYFSKPKGDTYFDAPPRPPKKWWQFWG